MAAVAAPPVQPNRAPAEPERTIRTWRPDPDRYLRQVKGGRIQARPYDPEARTRVNLGTFATKSQARVAVERRLGRDDRHPVRPPPAGQHLDVGGAAGAELVRVRVGADGPERVGRWWSR
jgi:hypothetical protein